MGRKDSGVGQTLKVRCPMKSGKDDRSRKNEAPTFKKLCVGTVPARPDQLACSARPGFTTLTFQSPRPLKSHGLLKLSSSKCSLLSLHCRLTGPAVAATGAHDVAGQWKSGLGQYNRWVYIGRASLGPKAEVGWAQTVACGFQVDVACCFVMRRPSLLESWDAGQPSRSQIC